VAPPFTGHARRSGCALLGAEEAEAGPDHERAVGRVDGERADEGVGGAARLRGLRFERRIGGRRGGRGGRLGVVVAPATGQREHGEDGEAGAHGAQG
jgi:hypothetical protein